MKVLVTGAHGQLGYSLAKTLPQGIELQLLDRSALDLSQLDTLSERLATFKPDAVINAAAYTAVDRAEDEAELAFKVNAEAPLLMARYCQARDIPMVQVSTDFVFDGLASEPYTPDSETAPLSVYGASKLQGEQRVLSECAGAYVVRTGWVYCEQGANFVKTMLRLAGERDSLGVVADQLGTPTYARHLAEMIWRLLSVRPAQRIYHFSDAGVASWYDFAVEVFRQGHSLGLIERVPEVSPIAASAYPTPARRPGYSVLDKSQTLSDLALESVDWHDALKSMLHALSQADVRSA